MKLPRKTATALTSFALAAAALTGCGASSSGTTSTAAAGSSTSGVAAVSAVSSSSLADTHAEADDGEYDTTGATTIKLADGATAVQGTGAAVQGDVVTITAPGTYLVSGSLSDGQVVVNSPDEGKVKLVLMGADITSSTSSPVVVTAADEAVVILGAGTTNTLSDAAASSADDDGTDAPTATLFSMADLTIAGTGTLNVHGLSNDAISSKDGLVVLSGTVTVDAVDDGLRGKDYLVVEGGTIDVTAGGDGLKSDNNTAGQLGWIKVDSGALTVSAGSQGADAVGAVTVAGGALHVTKSDEGVQAAVITVTGGTLAVTAADDGLNATAHTAVGGGEEAEAGVMATISGGTVTINAGSDGIDSNGSASITGGTVAIAAASGGGGGNGPLDVNGTLAAPGLITVDAGSIQPGQRVSVTDAQGKVVASFVADGSASSLVVTGGGLTSGQTYTVYAGTSSSATSTDGLTKIGTATASDGSQAGTRGGGRGRP